MRTLRMLKDFGEKGTASSNLMLDYRDTNSYDLSPSLENALTKSWVDTLKESERAENGRLLNYRKASQVYTDLSVVSLGPSCFRDYNETRLFLDGKKDPKTYGISEEDLEHIAKEVHVLSSFPALVVEDKTVMGRKGWKVLDAGAGKISFPGAGYLNLDKDTFVFDGYRFAKQIPQIVGREIREETKVSEQELDNISVLAIGEDTFKGSHRNPGIFSVAKTHLSAAEIKKRQPIAEDAWEHQGPFIFVPTDDSDLLESLIQSDQSHGAVPLQDKYASRIDGLANKKNIDTTGKAGLMLFLIGRHLYGDNWYKEQLEKHSEHVKIQD
jgi:hypothetical protein